MNICLVLGAGATLANGLHFRSERQRHTLPPLDTTFFERVSSRGIALSEPLQRYFTDFLGVEPTRSTIREYRMEEIFKDVSYDFRENPSDKTALNAYIDLVDLYLRLLRDTTNWLCGPTRTGAPIGKLLDAAANQCDRLTVITFNHDLVIENEIERRARLRQRWCLDNGYGSMSAVLSPLFPPSGVSRFRSHDPNECRHEKPITLLKLHGSMNWMSKLQGKRPGSSFLKGDQSSRAIHVLTRREIARRQYYTRSGAGRNRWDLWPIVVPPVYAKHELMAPALQQTWADASSALEKADRILFFGYSLPELDVEAEKLFERALLRNHRASWVDVVNPASDAAGRFASVVHSRSVRWHPTLNSFNGLGGFA